MAPVILGGDGSGVVPLLTVSWMMSILSFGDGVVPELTVESLDASSAPVATAAAPVVVLVERSMGDTQTRLSD